MAAERSTGRANKPSPAPGQNHARLLPDPGLNPLSNPSESDRKQTALRCKATQPAAKHGRVKTQAPCKNTHLIDLRSLEIFYWIVQLGGFQRAAVKLNTTQPAVSSHIATLESDLLASKKLSKLLKVRAQLKN